VSLRDASLRQLDALGPRQVAIGRVRRWRANVIGPSAVVRALGNERYFAGRNATWIWIATPGGGSNPKTSTAV
jgi:hypothetical protein